jgi:hypothetical protein
MLGSPEWRFGRSDDLGKIRICIVAAKAVEAQCGLSFMQRSVGDLVEDASEIVEKVNCQLISIGFNERPVLLEHLNNLDPKVSALD